MIKESLQRPMPSRLSHHTSFDSLKGILSNQEGKGICFHAVSNMYKNDKEEISMGEYILKYVRDVFHTESILHKMEDIEKVLQSLLWKENQHHT